MSIKLIEFGTDEYEQMLKLRDEILRIPLKLSIYNENLESEKDDFLIAIFEEDKILGCCILTRLTHSTIKLRQMAVKGNFQHKGLGKALLQFAERTANENQFEKITMDARVDSQGFYQKLGYSTSGEEFSKLNILHIEMEKKLKQT